MKSTSLKLAILSLLSATLIGCASQPAQTTTTTETTTKTPMNHGDGMVSALH